MITIKDIAKLAGVSPSTVSRVISNHPRISTKTSLKVKQIMKELNYHPNIMAKSLVSKTTHTLGIMLPRPAEELFQNYFFGELLRGIITHATRMNYELLLTTETSSDNELHAISRLVHGRRVDGILLLGSKRDDPIITFLEAEKFPFVLIGRSEAHPNAPMVDNDNVQTAYDATHHLIAQGHTRIGFVSGPPDITLSHDRMLGYQKALAQAGLDADSDWIVEGEFLQESGFRAMSLFMSLPNRPTAIVVIDDNVAFGVLRALAELHYLVPEDISVVSFNNIALSELASPPLSSIDIGTYQLGYTAVQVLLKILSGEPQPHNPVIIPHRLIVRESSLFSKPKPPSK
ncbi:MULTISPECIES: LacI family DNA-binding transcriptional regulator [Paenibacillus]|uniref:LacI family DNA-binding transcriptional regulator n=1 Tax=Paenibacillus TaxID=44249 RepID=UPI000B85B63D|nr:LacI family DNA-binding transcriptional regulator [Paenibacillus amylolyticus]